MSDSATEERIVGFQNAFDKRLSALKTREEKQQFIEGTVFALDGMVRYGHLRMDEFTPCDRELFIGSAIANCYSAAYHEGLDAITNMKGLVETHEQERALSMLAAATVQTWAGIPMSQEAKFRLDQFVLISQIKK